MRASHRMIAAVLGTAAIAACSCGGRGPRDVVVVTLDTVRADRLGCYGSAGGLTPHLDAFASRAALFEDASCAVPITLPSHATLFTGRYPISTGVRNNGTFVVPEEETTLAEVLKQAGFRTGAIVAAFPLQRRYGLDQGFDVYDDELPPIPAAAAGAFSVHFSERDARSVTDRALALWERMSGGRRFLWVHYFDAHAPYAPPEPFASAHRSAPYDGEIAYVDDQLGRLLDRVERDSPDAVVVIAADHGESLGEHGEKTHGVFLYQSTVHVPLLLQAPGTAKAGARIAAPVSLADVFPTVLGLLGLRAPARLDGVDLRPLLAGGTPARREVYAESYLPFLQFRFSPLTMLRDGALKYVSAPAPEVYDLRADPGESRNLSGRTDDESILARRLASLVQEGDPAAAERATGSLDEEAEARLRSLGYAAAPARVPAAATGRDPKTMVDYLQRYDRAVGLVSSGSLESGLAELRALAPLAPENFMVRYQIAAALLASSRPDEALAELDQVLAAAPEFGSAHLMKAEALAGAGRLDASIDAFEEAARRMPTQAEPKLAEGRALEARGRFDAAVKSYRDAIEREPASADAVRALVGLRASRGDLPLAARELRDLSSAHPTSLPIATGLADTLYRLGDAREASAALDRALALDPARPEALSLRAAMQLDAGRPNDAIATYRKILAARPGLRAAEWGLGRALVAGGTDAEAEGWISGLEARDPGEPHAAALRGMLLERRGDRDGALAAYRGALRTDPRNADARRGVDRLTGSPR